MWIHLPSVCCPSAPESGCSTSECDSLYLTLAPSATWRGRFLRVRYWRRVWFCLAYSESAVRGSTGPGIRRDESVTNAIVVHNSVGVTTDAH